MAELGYITLVLALTTAVLSVISFIFGGREKTSWFNRNARKLVIAVFILMTTAVIILETAILTHHFEMRYVYQYTSKDMSPVYLVSALWAGNAGSLLIWSWFLSVSGYIMVLLQKPGKRELTPYALAVVMFTQTFFTVLVLFFANPFTRLDHFPSDGMGMNPLLENPGMLFHPPTLLAGWAIFAVPFAFAISALINNKLDNTWISYARRWTIMAWLLLGIGNLIGAWWAYAVLGWGGYWAWDPIENAGLIPWLLSTALIHSMVVQKRRGGFKLWNIGLVVAVFATIKLGAFLTRSDILSSVHTFGRTAMDPLFLGLIAIAVIGSAGLIIWRRKSLATDMTIENIVSREAAFLLANLLFVGAAVITLAGTLAPAFWQSLSIGEGFFNRSVVPVLVSIILLIGICIAIGWRRPEPRRLRFSLLVSASTGLAVALALVVAGFREWYTLVTVFVAVFAVVSTMLVWSGDIRARKHALSEKLGPAAFNLLRSNRARYGGYLVHISMTIMAIGIVGSSVYDVQEYAVLTPGQTMTIKDYNITYVNLLGQGDGGRMEVWAMLHAYKGDKFVGEMQPLKVFHRSYEGAIGRVAIRYSLIEDLYVSLSGWEPVDPEDHSQGYRAGFMVEVNPLVTWIWIGGAVFLAGGLISWWPKGKKQPASGSENPLQPTGKDNTPE